jgi:exocyst complex component 7
MGTPRKAVLAEESAEVEVLFANMEKLKNLTKKIQGSLNRLEAGGKSVEDAIGPVYGNTQKLQTTNTSKLLSFMSYVERVLIEYLAWWSDIDRIIDAIERIRDPLDQRDREERIIRSNPQKVGLSDYIASLDRTSQALGGLKQSNLRTNQQAISELKSLLKGGTVQLEDLFKDLLKEDARSIEPLQYITKRKDFSNSGYLGH